MGITKKENKRKKQQHLRILNKHTVKHSVVQSKLTKNYLINSTFLQKFNFK